MAVWTQPKETEGAPVVLAFSDAPDNNSAIREITAWAREHGLVRSRETTLNSRQTAQGEEFFYSACYRLTDEDMRAAEAAMRRIDERRERMPMTAPTAELLRTER